MSNHFLSNIAESDHNSVYMKNIKWIYVTLSLLTLISSHSVLAEGGDGGGDGGDGGDAGDNSGDGDGHSHWDHGHHHWDHNHLMFGVGYYDPWFLGGWGGYYGPGLWGGYYNPGFIGSGFYGYRSYPYYGDPFFRPYYAYPPAVATPSQLPVYIQQKESGSNQSPTRYWYYCQNPEGYYPAIGECPSGWLQVAPQPLSQ
ncbi:MAG: hypothetical protein AABY47_01710 [Pseudomonadota bacterium]